MGKPVRRDLESSPLPGHLMTLVIYLWTSVATNVLWLEPQAWTHVLTWFRLGNPWSPLLRMTQMMETVAVIFLKLHVFLFQVRSPSINHLLCGWFPGIVCEEGQQGHAEH